MDSRISYADFAVALLDEIETPKHHRTHIGVETGREIPEVNVEPSAAG